MIDEAAFEAHRREPHVHCYRMVGSFDEAEDLAQETFLRAGKARERFTGNVRAWLDKVATDACLDALRRTRRRAPPGSSFAEIPWIQPYPDPLLDEVAPREDEPDAVLVTRETIELAYLALIQRVPPRQRAAASYLRAPGDTEFRAFKLDLLRIGAGHIKEITTFDARLFDAFGLPQILEHP
jgi:RNA polymerase sigma factor (sigma-70 family)